MKFKKGQRVAKIAQPVALVGYAIVVYRGDWIRLMFLSPQVFMDVEAKQEKLERCPEVCAYFPETNELRISPKPDQDCEVRFSFHPPMIEI
jgi:hypothetical protein